MDQIISFFLRITIFIMLSMSGAYGKKDSKIRTPLTIAIIFLFIFDLGCLVLMIYLLLVPPKRYGIELSSLSGQMTSKTSIKRSKVKTTKILSPKKTSKTAEKASLRTPLSHKNVSPPKAKPISPPKVRPVSPSKAKPVSPPKAKPTTPPKKN